MPAEKDKDNAPLPDSEGQERPVREQLKKTSINPMDQSAQPAEPGNETANERLDDAKSNGNVIKEPTIPEERGRLRKKRSHEEIEGESTEGTGSSHGRQHTRKRSRDSTAEEDELNNGQRKTSSEKAREDHSVQARSAQTNIGASVNESGQARPATPDLTKEKTAEAAVETLSSPKTKKSRVGEDGASVAVGNATGTDNTVAKPSSEAKATEGPNSGKAAPSAEIPNGSGFANISAASPFSALAGTKSPPKEPAQTSASAFASSGFGALSSSSTSGFGSIGKGSGGFGTGGSFATGSKTSADAKGDEKLKTSALGGLNTTSQTSSFPSPPASTFGSGKSGFASLGQSGGVGGFGSSSGFGSLAGAGKGGLTSFASGKPSAPFGGIKSVKPFGAAADEEEEGDDGSDDDTPSGLRSPLSGEEEKQDERFYAQDLETGEEDEATEYSCRAKLYNFATAKDGKKEWRERGLGMLRLNVKKSSAEQEGDVGKPQARFLMRADGSHRVVLNTPVKKEINFGAPTGGAPQGGYMYFMGTIDGNPGLELLQLKLRQSYALDLYDKITELQKNM